MNSFLGPWELWSIHLCFLSLYCHSFFSNTCAFHTLLLFYFLPLSRGHMCFPLLRKPPVWQILIYLSLGIDCSWRIILFSKSYLLCNPMVRHHFIMGPWNLVLTSDLALSHLFSPQPLLLAWEQEVLFFLHSINSCAWNNIWFMVVFF